MIEICKNVLLGFFHTFHMDIKGSKRKTDSAIVNQFLIAFNRKDKDGKLIGNNLPAEHELHAVYKKEESKSGSKRKRQARDEEARMEGEKRGAKKIAKLFKYAQEKGYQNNPEFFNLTQQVVDGEITWHDAYKQIGGEAHEQSTAP